MAGYQDKLSIQKESVFFIVGPTCSGKTDTAQWIAERTNSDILSADSMLVYKGLDIGTAKPSATDRARVRYWGIDLVDPGESFSAGRYRKAALSAIAAAKTDKRSVIVAGGTGLYIKSLVDGLAETGPADMELRSKAERLLKKEGIAALQNELKAENADLYESLTDKWNPRRLIRAFELARSGKEAEYTRWDGARESRPLAGLRFPPEQLNKRIELRARRMFRSGLIQEVERLLDSGFDSAPTARYAIGYAEAMDHIRGRCSLEEAINKTALRTRQLVKRQNTWFRHQASVCWVDCDEQMSTPEIAELVLKRWTCTGPTPINES